MWKRPTFAVLTKYCQHFYAFDGVAVGQDVTWPSNLKKKSTPVLDQIKFHLPSRI